MESINLVTPWHFLVILPLLVLLLLEFGIRKKGRAIAVSDLEFLRARSCVSGQGRKLLHIFLWGTVILAVGLLWTRPVLFTSEPLFTRGEQLPQKNIIVAIDLSRSMGQPLEIPDRDARFAMIVSGENIQTDSDTEVKPTRYELARETLLNFIDRFSGSRFGLVLFSTEPFLARWPTSETDSRFMEVMEETIGPGQRSQLQRFSTLTNIDEALQLTRRIFSKQDIPGEAVVLISDAEDEMETMSVAIRSLRAEGIRLYVIGVGISEIIAEQLADEFTGDAGFRIFRVDSDDEMEEAFNLVSELEESPVYSDEENLFASDLRWIIAAMLFVISVLVIIVTETILHQSRISDRRLAGGPDK